MDTRPFIFNAPISKNLYKGSVGSVFFLHSTEKNQRIQLEIVSLTTTAANQLQSLGSLLTGGTGWNTVAGGFIHPFPEQEKSRSACLALQFIFLKAC